MIMVLNEKHAAPVLENYPRVMAYKISDFNAAITDEESILTQSPDKGQSKVGIYTRRNESVVRIPKAGFLPSEDEINAVIGGHIKAGKVIDRYSRAIVNPKGSKIENTGAMSQMAVVMNVIAHNNDKKQDPVVVLLILDEPGEKATENDVAYYKARNKFIVKYMEMVCAAFEYPLVCDQYDTKGLKGKKKKAAKKDNKEQVKNLETMIKKVFGSMKKKDSLKKKEAIKNLKKYLKKNRDFFFDEYGRFVLQHMLTTYAVPLKTSDINNRAKTGTLEIGQIGNRTHEEMVNALLRIFTGKNLDMYLDRENELTYKEAKKFRDEVTMAISKQNRKYTKNYNSWRKMLMSVNAIEGLPKAVYGTVKKGKGKKQKEVGYKMNVDKFFDWFTTTTEPVTGTDKIKAKKLRKMRKSKNPEVRAEYKAYKASCIEESNYRLTLLGFLYNHLTVMAKAETHKEYVKGINEFLKTVNADNDFTKAMEASSRRFLGYEETVKTNA